MERFSIDHDRQTLIPFVKAAQALNPAMRFWASAWTPPPWMKTNNDYDSGAIRDEPAVYAAHALYLARFVEEYGKEIGIPGQKFGFARLIRAQAAGDFASLKERGRRVARIHLEELT